MKYLCHLLIFALTASLLEARRVRRYAGYGIGTGIGSGGGFDKWQPGQQYPGQWQPGQQYPGQQIANQPGSWSNPGQGSGYYPQDPYQQQYYPQQFNPNLQQGGQQFGPNNPAVGPVGGDGPSSSGSFNQWQPGQQYPGQQIGNPQGSWSNPGQGSGYYPYQQQYNSQQYYPQQYDPNFPQGSQQFPKNPSLGTPYGNTFGGFGGIPNQTWSDADTDDKDDNKKKKTDGKN